MRRVSTVTTETAIVIELSEDDLEQVLREHFAASLPGATSIEVRIDCGQVASAVVSMVKRTSKDGL